MRFFETVGAVMVGILGTGLILYSAGKGDMGVGVKDIALKVTAGYGVN